MKRKQIIYWTEAALLQSFKNKNDDVKSNKFISKGHFILESKPPPKARTAYQQKQRWTKVIKWWASVEKKNLCRRRLLVVGIGGRLVVVGLHGREEEDFLDVVGVGQEHGDAVDAHAPAGRRRKAVLQRGAEAFVEEHGLVVARGFVFGLKNEN